MASSPIYPAFGEAVAKRRNKLDMTQAALAAKVGMSRASLANIERGRQNVLLHHACSLASALDCASVGDLLPSIPKAKATAPLDVPLSDTTLTELGKSQIKNLIASALSKRTTGKVQS